MELGNYKASTYEIWCVTPTKLYKRISLTMHHYTIQNIFIAH